jgi:isoleucyl-tRNA synthetase
MDEQGRKMSKSLGNVVAPEQVAKQYGIDILRLWVMMSDTSEDLRIGGEILKQTAELYRRLRNTLRWVLGSMAGFDEAERVPLADMPELERWVLHRLTALDARLRGAVASYDWTGVYPELHNFCSTDLSAFYFDIRKDAIYCDRPDSLRRRSARTVLNHLHRCLTTWLAPALCFTAEEAWAARFGDAESVHLQLFPNLPAEWRDDALGAKWADVRLKRQLVTLSLEELRRSGGIGSSLQAEVNLVFPLGEESPLSADEWAELLIVSKASIADSRDPNTIPIPMPEVTAGAGVGTKVVAARGTKCVRCWRVLPEVGSVAAHPSLCLRCADAVESGLVCRSAA